MFLEGSFKIGNFVVFAIDWACEVQIFVGCSFKSGKLLWSGVSKEGSC